MAQAIDQGYTVNAAKEGDFYDDCPNPDCGTRDVPLVHKNGGVAPNGERHHNWAMYSCACCGTPWTRTTAQGQAENDAKGQPTKFLTSSAAAGRRTFLSPPTRQYQDNYARIFGHD